MAHGYCTLHMGLTLTGCIHHEIKCFLSVFQELPGAAHCPLAAQDEAELLTVWRRMDDLAQVGASIGIFTAEPGHYSLGYPKSIALVLNPSNILRLPCLNFAFL